MKYLSIVNAVASWCYVLWYLTRPSPDIRETLLFWASAVFLGMLFARSAYKLYD